MNNWKLKDEKAKRICALLAPKVKELEEDLKAFKAILAFYTAMRIKAQRNFTEVTVIPPTKSSKRPENAAKNILAKAKALSPEDRKALIKAIEGKMET